MPVKRGPQPRQHIYDLYWYFASERQRIFEKRLRGDDMPWSEDVIFQTYKFCNVFRAAELASARKRIKARYAASGRPLPLFFPPKWGMNGQVPVYNK